MMVCTSLFQRKDSVDAAVVELDTLADPVWSSSKNHDLLPIGDASLVLCHPAIAFIGRVEGAFRWQIRQQWCRCA